MEGGVETKEDGQSHPLLKEEDSSDDRSRWSEPRSKEVCRTVDSERKDE